MKYIAKRKIWYIISLVALMPGLVSMFINGLNLGIDFTGGSMLQVRFEQKVSTDQVRAVLKDFNLGNVSIQASENNTFLMRTKELSQVQENKLMDSFKSQLGNIDVLRNEKVGPVIGKELTRNAIFALIIAAILMIVYITIRFEYKFGIAAVLSLLHDVFIVIGIYSIFQIEIDSSFVAAILTIIGYSINDTIVIFDRIRENLRISKKMPLDELVDTSIIQSMARSINTGLSVIFVLIALYFFGGETTKIFSLTLLIGVLIGAYSSIFNASPMWYDLKRIIDGDKLLRKSA